MQSKTKSNLLDNKEITSKREIISDSSIKLNKFKKKLKMKNNNKNNPINTNKFLKKSLLSLIMAKKEKNLMIYY